MKNKKMKVDIWSDVMCPFCYIGKRRFENALHSFPHKDEVEVVWHSYQLDPNLQPGAAKDLYGYLAERKGQSREWSVRMHEHVTAMAAEAGLEYNFDKAKVANSFDAHRLVQLAKSKGLDDAVEEKLFKGYFTEGKDISDFDTLIAIGTEAGLQAEEIQKVLQSKAYADDVHRDVAEGEALGLRGVPFFVLDNKYGVSGAQDSDLFTQALEQAHKEWKEQKGSISMLDQKDGDSCDVDGEC